MFHSRKLNKSGHNNFAGYNYFELSDFLVPALEIFESVGLTSIITFNTDVATMHIINAEKPDESITITSPMAEANLKGCHPIQNLGAVETYTRRYLWVAALEIVEHDAVDSSQPTEEKKIRHSPVPEEYLTATELAVVQGVFSDIVIAFEEGRELEVIDLYYKSGLSNEQITSLWKMLAQHSKVRSFIKANKPEKVAA